MDTTEQQDIEVRRKNRLYRQLIRGLEYELEARMGSDKDVDAAAGWVIELLTQRAQPEAARIIAAIAEDWEPRVR